MKDSREKFEAIDKRFDAMQAQMDKRFEQSNKRFESLERKTGEGFTEIKRILLSIQQQIG